MKHLEAIEIDRQADIVFIKMQLSAYIIRATEDWYEAHCPSLDICTQGKTKKEARQNIKEAVDLFIETCLEDGVLDQALTERGFVTAGEKIPKRRPTTKIPATAQAIRIPTEIPMMAHR